ncbi:unnamed protein product [Oppiella nova]|uniref:Lysosomal dipeptide transporter MFSD1 n=1 Tax=Oppiella nova TaxID=334625 RepID=A0A7R9MD19_9ACAR|nr:unnamed protein product [Oppiella nova]CAG2174736.1 unnamed protein product [Oppiella nova]
MISMGASPILGALMGRLGRNLIFVLIAVLITMGAHALMAFTFLTPWVGMSCMGIGYSLLACTVWAMVSLVVPERTLGTAYGLTQALQNLGLGIIPLAVGPIIENKGYICLEILFLALLCVTIICIMILFVLDENRGGYLNMTPSERVAFDEKKTNIKSNDLQNLDNMGVDGVYSSKSTQL